MSVFENESKVSCEASVCQGIVQGIFYGTIFGVASKFMVRRNITKIHKFSAGIVLGNVTYGVIGFATFTGIFTGISCQLSRLIPDNEVRPIIKGISGFAASFPLAYYESRCTRIACRSSSMIGGIMTIAHLYPLLKSNS